MVSRTASRGSAPRRRQAGYLARHALVGIVLARLAQAREYLEAALLEGRVRQIYPDLAVADLHRIGAQSLALVEVPSTREVELPVVPVAGDDAALVQAPFPQGISLVRAAVVAGEHPFRGVEEGDLPSRLAEHHAALGPEGFERGRPGPGVRAHGWSSPMSITPPLPGRTPESGRRRGIFPTACAGVLFGDTLLLPKSTDHCRDARGSGVRTRRKMTQGCLTFVLHCHNSKRRRPPIKEMTGPAPGATCRQSVDRWHSTDRIDPGYRSRRCRSEWLPL